MEEKGNLLYKKKRITEMLSLTVVLTNLFKNHFAGFEKDFFHKYLKKQKFTLVKVIPLDTEKVLF